MSPRRRRGSPGPPRCQDCRAPITFFGSPHTGAGRPFDPRQLSGRDSVSAAVGFPVFGGRAWRVVDLVAELMVQRSCSSAEAESEIRDLPWHRPHRCPPAPSTTEEGPTQ
ncbi:hypothetical protein ACOACO_17590 [Nocardioides sp. CPCC 205120]|uniref:hypothetical protein n=1 Tax=Nocardioides sp. CPCC 205120 TaxID=3406462 RepID=UPI003B5147A0